MKSNNQNQSKRHYKSFWPIVIIAVLSSVIGGLIVLAVYNTNLQEQISSMMPGHQRALEGWKTYRNEKWGYEFRYPDSWFLNFEYPIIEIASVPNEEYLHGVGAPPLGNAWVTIYPIPCKNDCFDKETIEDVSGPARLIGVYKEIEDKEPAYQTTLSYQTSLSFWEGDKGEKQYREIYNQILSTFKFIK